MLCLCYSVNSSVQWVSSNIIYRNGYAALGGKAIFNHFFEVSTKAQFCMSSSLDSFFVKNHPVVLIDTAAVFESE